MPKRRIIKRRRRTQVNIAPVGKALRLARLGGSLASGAFRVGKSLFSGLKKRSVRPGGQGNLRGSVPAPLRVNYNRSSIKTRRGNMNRLMPANQALIKSSPGLTIGKYKRRSKREQIMAILNPPVEFNSNWTFQMDCNAGRVSACQIPIMTNALARPMFDQIYKNAVSDTVPVDTFYTTSGGSALSPGMMESSVPSQYKVMCESYRSSIRLYNSSTNTLRCRIVWYRPARDLDGQYGSVGPYSNEPINVLMQASNAGVPPNVTSMRPVALTSGSSGVTFTSTQITTNYNHCGWPITGVSTTASSTANNVAQLDSRLVPGSGQVKDMFNYFWKALKAENFELAPGNQYNTSVKMRNRIFQSRYDDTDVTYRRDMCVIGVVYVLGQIVFSDVVDAGTGIVDSVITTGSSQLSIMRQDSCSMRPIVKKNTVRVDLTSPFAVLADGDQANINVETGNEDTTYFQNGGA